MASISAAPTTAATTTGAAKKKTGMSSDHPPPAGASAAAIASDGGAGSSGEQNISYSAERIIGNGSFGVVFEAKVVETGEIVAIKKVLQDKRFKNRELQIMRQFVKDPHPCIVALKHCFYSQVSYLRFLSFKVGGDDRPATAERDLIRSLSVPRSKPASLFLFAIAPPLTPRRSFRRARSRMSYT